jgi:hypothetical protein
MNRRGGHYESGDSMRPGRFEIAGGNIPLSMGSKTDEIMMLKLAS